MPKQLNDEYVTRAALKAQSLAKWDERFMEIAFTVAEWSSCFQENRQVGAVIARDKRIVTTGYNGAGSGIISCKERCSCMRREKNIESGTRQEYCYAVHAEQNAVIQAAKIGVPIDGATIYCTHRPCVICAKIIINSGIKRVVYCEDYPDDFAVKLFKEAEVELHKYNGPKPQLSKLPVRKGK